MSVGVTVLLDFFGVTNPVWHQADLWEDILSRAIEIGGLTRLHVRSYQFPNRLDSELSVDESEGILSVQGGTTAFALLAESHISVHTWPEKGKVVIDVFTCGSESNLSSVIGFLIDQIPHSHMTTKRLVRGD